MDHTIVFRLDTPSCLLFVSQQGADEPAVAAQGDLTIYNISQDGQSSCCKAQVGDVFWSLGAAVACVRVDQQAFSFSVPESPGLYLTLVLDHGTSDALIDQLVAVLTSTTTFQETFRPTESSEERTAPHQDQEHTQEQQQQRQEQQERDTIEARAAQVGRAASWLVRGAASAASFGLTKGAQMITHRVAPGAQAVRVSEGTMRTLQRAQSAAESVASFTGRVATDVTRVTNHMALNLSKSIRGSSFAETLKSKGVDVDKVSRVMAASVGVLQEIFVALEAAGLEVLRGISNATTTVVHHRYGDDAAVATQMGLGMATNVVEATRNIRMLRPTRMVIATAKRTAVDVVRTSGACGTAATATTTTVTTITEPTGTGPSDVATATAATTTAAASTITTTTITTASAGQYPALPAAYLPDVDLPHGTSSHVAGTSAGAAGVPVVQLNGWPLPGPTFPRPAAGLDTAATEWTQAGVVSHGSALEGPAVPAAPLMYPPVRYYPELPS